VSSICGRTFQCRENGVIIGGDARDSMGLENLAWLATLSGTWLSPLIRKCERRFTDKSEDYLGLVACQTLLAVPDQ
jgi:hypothetical protein